MKFKAGIIFDHSGLCMEMLLGSRKRRVLVRIEKQIFEKIIDTAVGIDNLANEILIRTDGYTRDNTWP